MADGNEPSRSVEEAETEHAWQASEAARRREWETREADKKRLMDLWAKQEDIAMHFNDLTLRLRVQALAGIGAASLVAGGIFTHQGKVDVHQLGVFMMALAAVWLGICWLDEAYYQKLLKGAVQSILALEKDITAMQGMPVVQLSTKLDDTVKGGRGARRVFYGITFVILALGGSYLKWFVS